MLREISVFLGIIFHQRIDPISVKACEITLACQKSKAVQLLNTNL
jgi:hypothetical protein